MLGSVPTVGPSRPLPRSRSGIPESAVIDESARLPVAASELGDDDDLVLAGLTAHGGVNLLLSLEEQFGVRFPDAAAQQGMLRSLGAISGRPSARAPLAESWITRRSGAEPLDRRSGQARGARKVAPPFGLPIRPVRIGPRTVPACAGARGGDWRRRAHRRRRGAIDHFDRHPVSKPMTEAEAGSFNHL